MRRILLLSMLALLVSCRSGEIAVRDTITVSIPPFGYFVEFISGEDFEINVMVPPGSDPHIYEPSPSQVVSLRKSEAYISDGFLGFELAWLSRLAELNREMKILNLGDSVDIIRESGHQHEGHAEGADPHFWISPKSARAIASSVNKLLCGLNPDMSEKYQANFATLMDTINYLDHKAEELLSGFKNNYFMIFHPTLGYIARDYGLVQLAVEEEGKEPSPSGMRELIDKAKARDIRVIFVMKEFDTKNALTIASETGSVLKTINPLSGDWPGTVESIINGLHEALVESNKGQ